MVKILLKKKKFYKTKILKITLLMKYRMSNMVKSLFRRKLSKNLTKNGKNLNKKKQ